MNEFIKLIITNAVQLVVKALKFIPGLTKEEFDAALDEAAVQIVNAKTEYDKATEEDTVTVVEGMVKDGLEITKAALDAAGNHKADTWLQMGIDFLDNLGPEAKHPIAAGIKSWFQNTFKKKD